jgi:hypothetical protein
LSEHPIQGLMKTAMESIKDMVDVNTIVGDAVETPDGTVIIPISRVTFGFAAGGGNSRARRNRSIANCFYIWRWQWCRCKCQTGRFFSLFSNTWRFDLCQWKATRSTTD